MSGDGQERLQGRLVGGAGLGIVSWDPGTSEASPMNRFTRRARWSVLLLGAVALVTACRGEEKPATAEQAPEAAAEQAPAEKAKTLSPAQALFQSSGLNLVKGTPLDDAQLKQTGATRQERLTSQDPGLDIIVLGYEDATAAATALPKTASWINRSKTLHKAEAIAEGEFVLLVGITPGTEPTKESKAIVEKLIGLFIGGAAKL